MSEWNHSFKKGTYCVAQFQTIKNKVFALSQKANLQLSGFLQSSRIRDLENPLVIIGMEGCLHIVSLCLRFIPDWQKVIFVSNGLTDWENAWAKRSLRFDGFLQFRKRYYHADVIDFLFSYFKNPFGIIDYDCFVFDPSFFDKFHELNSATLLNSAFVHHNPVLSRNFPETFLLFFNTNIIKSIQKEFKVDSKPVDYSNLSSNIRAFIGSIGITDNCYPEEYKTYFDTMRLWVCLGMAKGYECHFVSSYTNVSLPDDVIYHVGSGSSNSDFKTPWRARGTYFWRRALEECSYPDLQKEYWVRFGDAKAKDFVEQYPVIADQLTPGYFDQVEKIIMNKSL